MMLKFYFVCPYCFTKIGFKRNHLQKTALAVFTVEKTGLEFLGRRKSMTEMVTTSLPAIAEENLSLSKEEHNFLLRFLDLW